jgi:gas vesicle protein
MSFKQGLSYLGAGVLGGAAGYIVGMLTAPAAGEETRRRLSWKLDDGKTRLRRTGQKVVDEAATRLEHGIESGKQKLDEMLQS